MTSHLQRIGLALVILLGTLAVPAEEGLGERVYFDASLVGVNQWETAPGISVLRDKNTLVFKTDQVDSGWITSKERLPFSSTASLSLGLLRTVRGKFLVQVEWFREDGSSFLGASEIFQGSTDVPVNKVIKLTDFLPQLEGGERPAKFRLKFWIDGKNGVVELAQAIIHVQRGWQQEDIQLMRTYTPDDAVVEDSGVEYLVDRGVLSAELSAQTDSASVVFWDRVNLNATGLILFDVESIQEGSISLHALCWNDRNEFLKEVAITSDLTSGGLYEIPIKNHQSDFPVETARMSFKVWINGKGAKARIAGIYYGVAE
jgi:hypothetical protein